MESTELTMQTEFEEALDAFSCSKWLREEGLTEEKLRSLLVTTFEDKQDDLIQFKHEVDGIRPSLRAPFWGMAASGLVSIGTLITAVAKQDPKYAAATVFFLLLAYGGARFTRAKGKKISEIHQQVRDMTLDGPQQS